MRTRHFSTLRTIAESPPGRVRPAAGDCPRLCPRRGPAVRYRPLPLRKTRNGQDVHGAPILEGEIREPYIYQRGHLTPMGLFELIAGQADEVIVLDDLGAVLRSDVAMQVLLSALEHPTSRDRGRLVKYRRQGREERAVFRGGIVCISNKELHDDDLLGAFKSRVHTLNYDPTDAQLGALMLDIANRGWPSGASNPEINPETARTIADYLIGELLRLACPFDLRLLVNKAFPDYQQWKDGEAESDWRDLVTASIEEHLVAVRHSEELPASREARKEEERSIVQEIVLNHPSRDERVRAWIERTGKSERAFYRRLAEMR